MLRILLVRHACQRHMTLQIDSYEIDIVVMSISFWCVFDISILYRPWISGWIHVALLTHNSIPSHDLTPNILHRKGLPMAPQFFLELMARVCFHRPVTAISASPDHRYLAVATECFLYVLRLITHPPSRTNSPLIDHDIKDRSESVNDTNDSSSHEAMMTLIESQFNEERNHQRLTRPEEGIPEMESALTGTTKVSQLAGIQKGDAIDKTVLRKPHTGIDIEESSPILRRSGVQPEVVAVRALPNTLIQLQWTDEETESMTVVATDTLVRLLLADTARACKRRSGMQPIVTHVTEDHACNRWSSM